MTVLSPATTLEKRSTPSRHPAATTEKSLPERMCDHYVHTSCLA